MAARYSRLEQAWFGALVLYTGAPLAMIGGGVRPPALDFWWDFAMVLGVFAAAGFALLPLLSARWWAPAHRSSGFLRLVQATHRQLAYVLLAVLGAHVGILVLLEPRVLEYLQLGAVAPMLAGLGATLLAVFITLSSRFREAWRWPYPSWRAWHAGLSLGVLALTGWHLIGAGFYVAGWPMVVALGWLLGVPTALTVLLRFRPWRATAPRVATTVGVSADPPRARAGLLTVAVTLTWLAGALLYAWSDQSRAPLTERALCVVSPCL